MLPLAWFLVIVQIFVFIISIIYSLSRLTGGEKVFFNFIYNSKVVLNIFIILSISIFFAFLFASFQHPEKVDVCVHIIEVDVAFIGFLFAGYSFWDGRMRQRLYDLHMEESEPVQGEANRLITEAYIDATKGHCDNIYLQVHKYMQNLKRRNPYRYMEIDKARRRLAHFWQRAGLLVTWGVVSKEELFGTMDPEIVKYLEVFSALTHFERYLEGENKKKYKPKEHWWPAELYISWAKAKAGDWETKLPARWGQFKRFRCMINAIPYSECEKICADSST